MRLLVLVLVFAILVGCQSQTSLTPELTVMYWDDPYNSDRFQLAFLASGITETDTLGTFLEDIHIEIRQFGLAENGYIPYGTPRRQHGSVTDWPLDQLYVINGEEVL